MITVNRLVKDDLCKISDLQEELISLGWQFRETVYNDGIPIDCYLQVAKDADSLTFNQHKELWG